MTSSALLAADDVLVEDDPGDVLLTREAFQDHPTTRACGCTSPATAQRRCGPCAAPMTSLACPGPPLLVLDLNLPRRSGLERAWGLPRAREDLLSAAW
jgi:hypothetical protein